MIERELIDKICIRCQDQFTTYKDIEAQVTICQKCYYQDLARNLEVEKGGE